MSAGDDRARKAYETALMAVRQAAARAVEAMQAYARVAKGTYRHSPTMAAEKLVADLEWVAKYEEEKRNG